MFQSLLQVSLQNLEGITLDMRAEKFESVYVKRQLMLSKITKFTVHRHVLLKLASMNLYRNVQRASFCCMSTGGFSDT